MVPTSGRDERRSREQSRRLHQTPDPACWRGRCLRGASTRAFLRFALFLANHTNLAFTASTVFCHIQRDWFDSPKSCATLFATTITLTA